MAKIDSYSLDASITDNDSVLGIDSASGATKRFTMLSMKTYIASEADITAVIAGTGLSGGATSGDATLSIDSSVVTLTGTQTLTNKTLTAPVISTISNTGTLTLPTSTDTLVGRATTDTLTNKTLTSPSIATPTWTATESAIANGDYLLFLDASASSETKKEGLDDIATLFAGTGLSASNSVLSVDASQTQITSVGTITTGTWQASLIGIDYGGTGLSGETDGMIVIADGSGAATHLDVGSSTGITILGTIGTGVWQGTAIDSAYIDTTLTAQTSMLNSNLVVGRDADNQIKFSTDDQIIFRVAGGDGVTLKASGEIEATSLDISGNVEVAGNLTVSGSTTTVNTATLSIEDPLVVVGSGNNSSDSVDLGLYGLYDTSGSQDLYSGLFRDASDSGKWKLFKDLQTEPTTTVNTSGTGYAVGTLVANLEGTVTGNASGLSSTLAVSSGGTNATSFADKSVIITQDSGTDTLAAAQMDGNGELLIGGTSGPAVSTLTAGSNISITNADGSITIASSAAGAAFTTVAVSGQSNVVATGSSDTLTLVGGSGTTITTNAGTDTITINAGANTVEVDEFTGNGSTTAYTLSTACTNENNLLVYMDGVYQHHNTYAVSGTTLTFDTNVPNGSKVEAYHMISVNVSNMVQSALAGALIDVSASTGDVTFNVDLTEASEAAIADGDYILFLDGGATGTHAKEAIADVATLFAGTGLTASSSVINIDAAQTGITSVVNTSLEIGRDADNRIKFGTDNQIIFEVDGGDNVIFKTSGEIEASSLDISGDVDVDGTLEADAITINGTAIGSIYSPVAGSASIATVGTISTGVWQGTAIASAYIAADAITGAKIADDAIDSEHYTDGSIDTAHLAADAVTGAKIADDAITGAKIADDAIDSEHYTDGSIDTAHIADSQVTTAKIADNNITHDKLENRYTVLSALGSNTSFALDFSAATTFTATASGNATFTFSNAKQGQVIDLILTGNHTITFSQTNATFNKVGSTDYDGSSNNLIQIVCTDDSANPVYMYSIGTYASDSTP